MTMNNSKFKTAFIGFGHCAKVYSNLYFSQLSQSIIISKSRKGHFDDSCSEFVLDLSSDNLELSLFNDLEALIFSVPIGNLPQTSPVFVKNVQSLVKSCPNATKVMLSTIGVYPNQLNIDEATKIEPTPRAQFYPQIENEFLDNGGYVLRLGGLVDAKRNPGRFLSGKTTEDGPINLVHTEDVAHAINFILEHRPTKTLFNIVSPHHLKKSKFYPLATKKINLPPPRFEPEHKPKLVLGELITKFGFSYTHQNFFESLELT